LLRFITITTTLAAAVAANNGGADTTTKNETKSDVITARIERRGASKQSWLLSYLLTAAFV